MVQENNDDRLQRVRAYDRTALAAVYDDYYPRLYRYIYHRVGDLETAQDLTAVVFQRFLQTIRAGAGPERHLKAWLYRVAHNLVVDHYRHQQHEQYLPLTETLVTADHNPEQAADQAMMAEQVRTALGYLTQDQQQVITLKFLEGLSNAEIAAVVEKPVGAVKSLQHRALAALQRSLLPSGETV
ncbi:MAG: sigma-70 family RNA polymerase sigma factor [Ardenticatenaceae bacterium]|nr:sigma-70 family RNA polymerase sigma factor [Ardenticatenaceae bacterium]